MPLPDHPSVRAPADFHHALGTFLRKPMLDEVRRSI